MNKEKISLIKLAMDFIKSGKEVIGDLGYTIVASGNDKPPANAKIHHIQCGVKIFTSNNSSDLNKRDNG